ncbi:MAG: hypothetical protein P8N25_03700, partial [Alphaproteobacteria bacterium]|nr:hypothetical protein [Alphaproteobacteria bacterium]
HAFYINIYGVLDNLTHLYICEKGVKDINNINIGLNKDKTKKHFSENINTALENKKDWLEYIKYFRNALAHRIAPYVPPYQINEEDKQKYDSLMKQYDSLMKQEHEILNKRNKIQNEKNSLYQAREDKKKFDKFTISINKIDNEIDELSTFCPYLTHSFNENNKYNIIYFQPQVLNDWESLICIIKVFMSELNIKINENNNIPLPFYYWCWKSRLRN